MRNLWVILFFASSSLGYADSSFVIAPQQCVWRAGDNPAWAAPHLDESGWQPLELLLARTARVWVRCHADLRSLRTASDPGLQVRLEAAYELFLNGQFTGKSGNLKTAFRSVDRLRSYPISSALISDAPVTIALRIATRPEYGGQPNDVPEIRAGDELSLHAIRALYVLEHMGFVLTFAVPFFIVGIIGLVQLLLFYFDRTRLDILWLSIASILFSAGRVALVPRAFEINYSARFETMIIYLSGLHLIFQSLFFFALAKRRIPRSFWVLIILAESSYLVDIFEWLATPELAWRVDTVWYEWKLASIGQWSHTAVELFPFVVFWPWTRQPPRLRGLVFSCLLWGAAMTFFSLNQAMGSKFFGQYFSQTFAIVAACTCIPMLAIFGLLFRDQRQITQERATLAGELQAAREIQLMLCPERITSIPSVAIDVAFRPMRDVGGDFYVSRPLASGCQRVVIGDVSGKGAAAAMSATLLIGGAQDHDDYPPGRLLAHLDRVMYESQVGGFATCLCADFAPDGRVTVANAGHLAPYRSGHEVPIEGSLPLGLNAQPGGYSELSIFLNPGDRLSFLSDGVVEARSASGEMFGFERTAALSTQPAQEIAGVAQSFGQEDDITVLIATFTGVQGESL